jgi:hypothetical protein
LVEELEGEGFEGGGHFVRLGGVNRRDGVVDEGGNRSRSEVSDFAATNKLQVFIFTFTYKGKSKQIYLERLHLAYIVLICRIILVVPFQVSNRKC